MFLSNCQILLLNMSRKGQKVSLVAMPWQINKIRRLEYKSDKHSRFRLQIEKRNRRPSKPYKLLLYELRNLMFKSLQGSFQLFFERGFHS